MMACPWTFLLLAVCASAQVSRAQPTKMTDQLADEPPSLTTAKSSALIGVLIAIFLLLAFCIIAGMVIIFCKFYRASSNLQAQNILRPVVSGLSGKSRSVASCRSRSRSRSLKHRVGNREAPTLKSRCTTRSKGRTNTVRSGRGSLKGRGKTKGKVKRPLNNGSVSRDRSAGRLGKSKGKGHNQLKISRKQSQGKGKSRRPSQGQQAQGKVGKVGSQTMLYNEGVQYYKMLLKSVHSVKSVSQYFADQKDNKSNK